MSDQVQEHPWVTKGGDDPLLSAEENCSEPVEIPNALEVNHAFTRRMSHLLCVVRILTTTDCSRLHLTGYR